ncbi:uncharacterized protein LOC129595110 [Paramacrobiotus metropolitanus]|uniref:uncharacterized protein LOC129595110 n=1 Tax=Paramacrobiotus metropolitanus TaxID=2943436 RepID=UPI0024457B11|nr:uncharacterized protein LOC129595110 [Paramacrobiotus metropolitanus]
MDALSSSYVRKPGPSRQPDAPPSYKDVMQPADAKEMIPLTAHPEPIVTQPSTDSTDVILKIDPPGAPGDMDPADQERCCAFRSIFVVLIVVGVGLCAWDTDYRRYRGSDEFIPDKITEARDKEAYQRTGVGGILLGIGMLGYLIDAMATNCAKIIFCGPKRLEQQLKKVEQGKPKLTWQIKCFHRDIKTRVIDDPETGPRTETRTKIFTTWSGTREFQFNSWSDETPDQTGQLSGICHIRFQKNFVLADAGTKEAFNAQKQAFINANKDRDKEYTIQDIFEIEGYLHKLTVRTTRGGWWCCTYLFLVASFLLYPWLCCWSRCWNPVEYTLTKKLSV